MLGKDSCERNLLGLQETTTGKMKSAKGKCDDSHCVLQEVGINCSVAPSLKLKDNTQGHFSTRAAFLMAL